METVADALLGEYRKKCSQAERLCSQAIANDGFCREYIGERFVFIQHIEGKDSVPCVIFQDLSFWQRVRLAWRLVWTWGRGGMTRTGGD